MEKFFNSDNGVMRALSKLFDMGVLTLIYLVFCIPVVTIGAATTSLYYVSAKVLRHNRSYVWTEFWSSFKMNFAQSTVVWLLIAVISLLLVFNMQLVGVTDAASAKGGYLAGVYFAMLIFISCISCYVFPFISRFSMKLGQIFAAEPLLCVPAFSAHAFVDCDCCGDGRIDLCCHDYKYHYHFPFCSGIGKFCVYVSDGAYYEKIYAERGAKVYGRGRRNYSMV